MDDEAPVSDVTGTWITSDKPIGVFAGVDEAFVPTATKCAGNPLVQMQMPVDTWGTNAVVMGFAGRKGGDSYRVLAASNGTVVTVITNGGTNWTGTLTNAGDSCDLIINGPVEFQGTKPIQVAHFANGSDYDNPVTHFGDPCEILIPPTGHYLTSYTVMASNPNCSSNYLNVVVEGTATTNTFLNGILIPSNLFVPIGSSGYYGAQMNIPEGTNTTTSSKPVGVEVYGFGLWESYGYFGGLTK